MVMPTYPSTSDFPPERALAELQRPDLEQHYLTLRQSYKRLRIGYGQLRALNQRYREDLVQIQSQLQTQITALTQDKASILQERQAAIENLQRLSHKMDALKQSYDNVRGTDGILSRWERLQVLLTAVKEFFAPTVLIEDNFSQEDPRRLGQDAREGL